MNIEIKRHSLAHLMAAAILEIQPKAQLGVGPAIENGFYHDIDLPKNLTPEDLPKIEKRTRAMIKNNVVFKKTVKPINQAIKEAKAQKLKYRLELIEELKAQGEKNVSFYQSGDFINLCKGPHIKSAKEIDPDSFKLTHLAGAYWRGDEKNKMLQRVYGLAFETKAELEAYLKLQAEAEKRDHRVLGQKLELFMLDDEVGQGLPLWLPKGAFIRHKVMEFAFNTYLQNGYEPVVTPHIASHNLWRHSGHLDFYRESMYDPFGIEGEEYRLKPMNCPMHLKMYNFRPRSYRELPLRWTEMGTVYRYERSGTLHGLARVRGFTQDDAHIICSPEQLDKELSAALKLTLYILKTFGFKEFEMNLSVRDPENKAKFIGSDKDWHKAENALKKAMADVGYKNFVLDVGGAVFYGPKIDIKVADSIGRKWQLSTIQVDFNLPGRFKIRYTDKTGKEQEPYMIHRALLGSLERFMGVYIEHTGGAFPAWLSPVQAQILPIGKGHLAYGKKLLAQLKEADLRIELNDSSETIGKKIRSGEIQKIPYLLIVGDKEVKANSVAVRSRAKGDLGAMKVEKFVAKIQAEISAKT